MVEKLLHLRPILLLLSEMVEMGEVFLKLKQGRVLSKAFDKYSDFIGTPREHLGFLLNRTQLSGDDAPGALGLSEGDSTLAVTFPMHPPVELNEEPVVHSNYSILEERYEEMRSQLVKLKEEMSKSISSTSVSCAKPNVVDEPIAADDHVSGVPGRMTVMVQETSGRSTYYVMRPTQRLAKLMKYHKTLIGRSDTRFYFQGKSP